jgi:hypothetical protein
METEETAPEIAITPAGEIEDVTIHPLVLLSAADHYHRVARGTRKRVVGVLLGTVSKGKIDATNSFAVPFEEDSKNPVSTDFQIQLLIRLNYSLHHAALLFPRHILQKAHVFVVCDI